MSPTDDPLPNQPTASPINISSPSSPLPSLPPPSHPPPAYPRSPRSYGGSSSHSILATHSIPSPNDSIVSSKLSVSPSGSHSGDYRSNSVHLDAHYGSLRKGSLPPVSPRGRRSPAALVPKRVMSTSPHSDITASSLTRPQTDDASFINPINYECQQPPSSSSNTQINNNQTNDNPGLQSIHNAAPSVAISNTTSILGTLITVTTEKLKESHPHLSTRCYSKPNHRLSLKAMTRENEDIEGGRDEKRQDDAKDELLGAFGETMTASTKEENQYYPEDVVISIPSPRSGNHRDKFEGY